MELLGRIFGKSKKPDLPPSVPEPQLKAERKDYRPDVDPAYITDRIAKAREKLSQPPKGQNQDQEQRIGNDSKSQDATVEILEELTHAEDTLNSRRKYVREEERILFGVELGNHVYIAVFGNMETPDDAGYIGYDESAKKLIIYGSSPSLSITTRNANRPATLELLRKMAPNVVIDEGSI